MCEKNKCSKIVSRSATGADYVIEGNRRTWITEDGGRWISVDDDPQYTGPTGSVTSDGSICANTGYQGRGLFW